ncbi:MAG: ABC transporter substrate-binding protein, partial [Ilumatobacteraceae bacterium]
LGATALTAGAQSSSEKPKATDVGITDTEIHVAVIADVDNPIVPNLFKGSKDAVEGAAKYLNSKAGGGGLAGRKVVVDFYDSKLNANATTNAEIQACQNDVAAVGTSAVSLASVDEMRNCKDSTGATTGLPDIPFVSTALAQQCSDQSFPMAPPQVICSTATQHPQTFQPNVGRGYYYKQKYGNDLHGIYIFGNDSKSARDSSYASGIGQVRQVCCKADQDFDVSGFAPQSAYTPIVQSIKSHNATWVMNGLDYSGTLKMRKEAAVQGVSGVKVWACSLQCYAPNFITQGGPAVEQQYAWLQLLPFEDQGSNPMLDAFLKYDAKPDAFGEQAFSAGLLFQQVIEDIVAKSGPNAITRAAILAQIRTKHAFDAGGLIVKTDIAGKTPSNCIAIVQVQNGKWVRVDPVKKGTFDCSEPGGITTITLDPLKAYHPG